MVWIVGSQTCPQCFWGAFGLNSSIYGRLQSRMEVGAMYRQQAKTSVLLPTYDNERRLFANRVIRCSGAYLRFICNSRQPLARITRSWGGTGGPR